MLTAGTISMTASEALTEHERCRLEDLSQRPWDINEDGMEVSELQVFESGLATAAQDDMMIKELLDSGTPATALSSQWLGANVYVAVYARVAAASRDGLGNLCQAV